MNHATGPEGRSDLQPSTSRSWRWPHSHICCFGSSDRFAMSERLIKRRLRWLTNPGTSRQDKATVYQLIAIFNYDSHSFRSIISGPAHAMAALRSGNEES